MWYCAHCLKWPFYHHQLLFLFPIRHQVETFDQNKLSVRYKLNDDRTKADPINYPPASNGRREQTLLKELAVPSRQMIFETFTLYCIEMGFLKWIPESFKGWVFAVHYLVLNIFFLPRTLSRALFVSSPFSNQALVRPSFLNQLFLNSKPPK